jgi:microcystin-dependent protein
MSSPFVGEIRQFAGNFAPVNWMLCNGQVLPIDQYEVLYTLIGTTYGGDGVTTFALPNLQGRFPIHFGTGGGATYVIGQSGGVENVTLTTPQLPAHTHTPNAAGIGGSDNPSNNFWGTSTAKPYTTAPGNLAFNASSILAAGAGVPHDNMNPFLAITFIISLFGIFPSQS